MSISLPITSRTGFDDNTFQDVRANDQAIVDEIDDRDATYKTVYTAQASLATFNTGTYTFGTAGNLLANGGALNAAGGFYLAAADYAIPSKTTKFRIKFQVLVGSTSPGATALSVSLGSLSVLVNSLAVVAGTGTVASSGLSTSNVFPFVGSNTSLPPDGFYAPVVVISGATAPAAMGLNAQIQICHV